MRKNKINKNIILYIVLIACSLLVIVPFAWMIFSSFKTVEEFYYMPPKILPKKFILDNFKELFQKANFGLYYLNSLYVAAVQVVLDIIIVTTAGYGFAKYDFKGKKVLFTIVLATTMVPWVATIIPLYIMAYKSGVVNTYFGLIFPGLADAFSIFLARNFMSTIPTTLIEAGRIDGAGEFKIFRVLVLPLTKPIIAVLTINKFIGSWNAFVWPLLVVTSEELRTLPIAVAKFSSQYYDAYNLKMAAATLAIIPVLIVYVSFQKYFVAGISLTGIKE
ncbi:MAG: carbohydrate ABC transporter permease [Clostridiales bacterium]|nr:carbohydrate ABC transporter permease [Clostridiales bacterium]HBM80652.1 sugar ABC transporter permease [Clostridiaceae bacterium]